MKLMRWLKQLCCPHSATMTVTRIGKDSDACPYVKTATHCMDCGKGVPLERRLSDANTYRLLGEAEMLDPGEERVVA